MAEIYWTSRLVFRTWDLPDIDAFIELCGKPGITDFSSDTYKNVSPEKARLFIEKETNRFQSSRASKFAVCSIDDRRLLGVAGIFEMDSPFNGCFEINYRFPEESWGKGIGTEAAMAMIEYGFEALGLERVYAIILKENVRSRRVLEKIGMTVEKDLFWHDHPAQLWGVSRGD